MNKPYSEVLTHFLKFGRNPAVTTTEDVWNGGGIYTGHPTSTTAETIEVFSSDAADTNVSGSGAWTFEIVGLKSATSTIYETETLNLNGTNAVTSTNTWWRVNRARVLTAGSGGANVGNITVRHTTTTANIFAVLPAGFNQTSIAAYTVPYTVTGYLEQITINSSRTTGTGYSVISLRSRKQGEVYQSKLIYSANDTASIRHIFNDAEVVFEPLTDIVMRVDSVSSGSFDVSASFEIRLST